MYIDFNTLDIRERYKLLSSTIVSRPIAWVTTVNQAGAINAAPFSFFNAFSGTPPILCLGIGEGIHGEKDTLKNIRDTRELVVNLVPESCAVAMNGTSAPHEHGVNELELAGLETRSSRDVRPPRIALSPAAFECRVRDILLLGGPNHLVIAEVVSAHIVDEAFSDIGRMRIDASRLQLVGRMESPGWYVRTSDRFMLKQPTAD